MNPTLRPSDSDPPGEQGPGDTAPEPSPRGRGILVFVSFDVDHDTDLYELLLEQSTAAGSNFTVCGGSRPFGDTEAWRNAARRSIRAADQVIVVCGEFTDGSPGVFSELRIVQEEGKPYLLLWGRREPMCTKPAAAKPAEAMYSWTRPILEEQVDRISRIASKEAESRARVLRARALRGSVS